MGSQRVNVREMSLSESVIQKEGEGKALPGKGGYGPNPVLGDICPSM